MIAVEDLIPKDWELTKASEFVENMHEMEEAEATEGTVRVLEATIRDVRAGRVTGVAIQALSSGDTPKVFMISLIRPSQVAFYVACLKRILKEFIMQDLAIALLSKSVSPDRKNSQDLN